MRQSMHDECALHYDHTRALVLALFGQRIATFGVRDVSRCSLLVRLWQYPLCTSWWQSRRSMHCRLTLAVRLPCRYGQAGTPHITVTTEHDPAAKTYTITVKQRTPSTKDQPEKVPLLIPVGVGLLAPSGEEVQFTVTKGRHKQRSETHAVLLAEDETSVFELSGVSQAPVPSLLRNFSAPVNMTVEGQKDEDLVFIMKHDTDEVNRYVELACQQKRLLQLTSASHCLPDMRCTQC